MDRAVDVAGAMAAVWLPLWGSVTLKTGMVLCIAGLCWLIVRRRSAAVRHFLLASTVCVLAALPTLTLVMPAWSVRALPAGISRLPAPPTAPAAFSADEPPPSPNPAGASPARDLSHDGRPEPTGAASAPNDIPSTASAVAAESVVHHTSATAVAMVNALPSALLLVWLSGVGLVVLRYANGLGRLVALLRRSTPMAASDVDAILPGIARTVRIVVGGTVPLTFGWLRPVLVVPADFADWPDGRRRAVVLHEYAHIARRDWVANLVAQIGCALYWYNPFVWLIARRMCIEAEHACDDRVLLAGIAPADYATHLLDVAKSMRLAGRVPAAAIAMASRPMIKDRMQSILDDRRLRRIVPMKSAVIGTMCALTAALPLAAVRIAANEPQPTASDTGIVWTGDGIEPPNPYAVHVTENRLILAGQYSSQRRAGFYLNLENTTSDGHLGLDSLKVALAVADSSDYHYIEATPAWQYGHDYHVHVVITPTGTSMQLDNEKLSVANEKVVGADGFPLLANSLPVWAGFPAEYWVVEKFVTISMGNDSVIHYDFPGSLASAGPSDFASPVETRNMDWTMDSAKTLTIDGTFALVRRADYAPLVDRYGQVRYPDWPGKVMTDQQLTDSVANEQAQLAALPGLSGNDPFGGNMNAGWREVASGFYRVVSRNGFSWLISPSGNPCWYTSLSNAPDVGPDTGTPVTGRESIFAYLPPSTLDLSMDAHAKTEYVSFADLNMERKYGTDWQEKEYELTKQRLTSWGFTGEGDGSDHIAGMPYIQGIWQEVPDQGQLDVFDPGVRSSIRAALAQQMQTSLSDPYLVGWSVGSGAPYITTDNVAAFLSSYDTTPVKTALVAYALQHIYHGDVAKMASMWKSEARSVAEFDAIPDAAPSPDVDILISYLADQYYAYLYATVKAIDPNHLYFGAWTYTPLSVQESDVQAIVAHCDVFDYTTGDQLVPTGYATRLSKTFGKPFFLSDECCPPDYSGLRNFGEPIGQSTVSDALSGGVYREWANSCAISPKCIGMSWLQYRDQPVTGHGPGSGSALVYGRNVAFGLVDVTDRPKWDMVLPIRDANLHVTQERLAATAASTE